MAKKPSNPLKPLTKEELLKVKPITAEDIKKLMQKDPRDAMQKHLDRMYGKVSPYDPRVGKCGVCKGVVTETFSQERKPNSGPAIYGPGSIAQFYWKSSGLFCQDCGLSYHKLPKVKNDNVKG